MKSFQGARDLYEIVSQEMISMYDAIMSAPGVYGTRGAGAGFGGCLVAFVQSDSLILLLNMFSRNILLTQASKLKFILCRLLAVRVFYLLNRK